MVARQDDIRITSTDDNDAPLRELFDSLDRRLRPEDVADLHSPHLLIHHDEDAEVYLNGESATRVRRHTSEYIEQMITPGAKAALKAGKNVIAAHCKQTSGGQYIDVGIVEIEPGEEVKSQK